MTQPDSRKNLRSQTWDFQEQKLQNWNCASVFKFKPAAYFLLSLVSSSLQHFQHTLDLIDTGMYLCYPHLLLPGLFLTKIPGLRLNCLCSNQRNSLQHWGWFFLAFEWQTLSLYRAGNLVQLCRKPRALILMQGQGGLENSRPLLGYTDLHQFDLDTHIWLIV